MTARIWLHDSTGAWLNTVVGEDGVLIADTAYAPGINAPLNSTVRIEGVISVGESFVNISPKWWTLIEDVSDKGS